jgi:hypothetical protein
MLSEYTRTALNGFMRVYHFESGRKYISFSQAELRQSISMREVVEVDSNTIIVNGLEFEFIGCDVEYFGVNLL